MSGFAGLSSSSGADDALFVRTQAELERLWSGVLGCAESDDPFTIRNRFNDSGGFEDAGGGAVPAGTSRDYSECGKRALRNASSRMLVDAVEGALREGGLALFEEGFRIDSSIGWTAGESVRGALDAVLPLWSNTGAEGTGRVLFLQPGAVFWSGHAEQERIDTNLGLVFRRSFSRDLVGGVSLFYDRNLNRELERIGGGLDIQGGIFTGGLNYYHPLGGGWREGRVDYEERAQRGMDLRIGLATEDVRFDGSMGLWRFKGEEDEATKWRPSLGVDAGFRVLPGIFLEAGYEYHNKEDSLGSRWNMGLAFRFDLPGLQGSGFGPSGYEKPDLWRPVEREKRVLYEERLAVPRVELTTEEEDVRVAEGGTATITGVIAKPLKQDAALHLVMHSTSTATHGPDGDFTLGHRVFEGDAPPPGEMTDCPALPCVVPLPAGTTMFEVSVNVLADETNEVDEHIDLRAEVPAAHAGTLRSSGTVRVTIGAHDNTIVFGESSQTEVEEDGGTAEVVVDVHLPAPMLVVLNIAAVGGTATQDDYILPPSVTIPAGQSSGMVVLRGRDDRDGEGSETVFLGLTAAGELPEGWVLQESATHGVTITDDDLAIGFAEAEHEEAEPDSGTTTFTVAIELTMSPEEEVTVPIAVAEHSEEFVPADVSYAPSSLTFAAGTADLSQDVTFTVHADAAVEADEVVQFLIEDHDSHMEGANAFSVGQRSFALTIPANDNVVRMEALAGNSFEEGESISLSLTSDDDHPAPDGGLPVAVTVTPQQVDSVASTLLGSASDEDISFTAEQVIPAGQTGAVFDIDIVNDAEGELTESFEISIAEGANFPSSWGSVVNVPATFSVPANDNVIGFAQSASRVVENVTGGVHNIAIDANLPLPMSAQLVTFNIATGGTATEDTDYSLSGKTVVFNANDASADIPVTIVNDSDLDVGETIEL
ncbi:MAG: inverse autotransporter beta domain-containing protein, partial [Hyphomicrobiales bacterium]|nr:inverse autotransporter beta domain-containing protein [Hyphomicrobiales bacterium]